jgi:chromosomal replication initiator protein
MAAAALIESERGLSPPAPEPFEGCTEVGDPGPRGPVTFMDIRRAVCSHYGVSWDEVRSDRRDHKYMIPRHVIAWLAYSMTGATLPGLGRLLNRDHTTILHAVANAAPKRMDRDPEFAATVRMLRAKLEDGRC